MELHNKKASFFEGFQLAFENALSLKKVAQLAAENNEFGVACSLNVLAAEEIVKANFILIQYYNPSTAINDFEGVFKNHKVKHFHVKGFAALQEVQLKRFKTDLAVLYRFYKIIDTLPEATKSKTKEDFSTWYEIEDWVQRFEARKINYNQIVEWANKANDDKNKGLYVDLRNGKWVTPKTFTQEKYAEESKYTDAMIDFLKGNETIFAAIETIMKGREAER